MMQVSQAEIQGGCLSPENLARAVRILGDVGYIVLEGVIDPALVGQLRETFAPIFQAHLAQPEVQARVNAGHGYVQLDAPFISPFSDEVICANPLAVQIMEAVLGPKFVSVFYNTNSTVRGTDIQPIHIDMPNLVFPGFQGSLPCWSLVVNIPLIDFNEANGSTEVWPGTHLNPVEGDLLERSRYLPSARVNAKVGDLVIRDLRVWHRGMPSQIDQVRTMLALVYHREWLHIQRPLIRIPRARWDSFSERTKRIYARNLIID
jgi:ectoine hydroxylase-related dioxygenase (phytanoyl-CoA dioxygenase family)